MPTGLVETKNISGISDRTITVSSAFSEAANAQSIWLIQTTDVESQQFRVLNVVESGDGVFGVTALAYNESIYSAIESDITLTQRDISNATDPPDAVTGITGSEFLYEDGQSTFSGVDLSWIRPLRAAQYQVQYRIDDDNWTLVTTTSPSLIIRQTRPGTMYVQIQAYNQFGKGSTISTAQFQIGRAHV